VLEGFKARRAAKARAQVQRAEDARKAALRESKRREAVVSDLDGLASILMAKGPERGMDLRELSLLASGVRPEAACELSTPELEARREALLALVSRWA
jgi:hypothetical protein